MRHWLVFPAACVMVLFLALSTASAQDNTPSADEEEVVVTAARLPVLISEAPGTVLVITAGELDLTPGLGDLAEDLSLWSGLQLNTNGHPGSVSSLGLGGASSQQVLIMIDGIPLINPQNGTAQLGLLAPGIIDRVEMVSGPFSALYGEDAMGGVINLLTGIRQGGDFSLDGSTAGGNLGFSYGWDGGGFALGLTDTAGERPNSDYRSDWQFLTAGTTWLDWDLKAGIYRYADEKGIPGSIGLPTPAAYQEDAEHLIYFAAGKTWGGMELAFKTYRVEIDCLGDDGWAPFQYEAWRTGAESQAAWKLGPKLSLLGVCRWERTGVESASLGEHEADAVNIATQLLWQPREELAFYLGDLWHDHEQYGTGHSPRLSAVYRLRPDLVAKVMYGEAFRAPTFNDLYWPNEGNPDLLPEYSRTFEGALEYQYLDRLVLGLSAYRTQAENLIEWLDDGTGIYSPINRGRVRMNGLDLKADWRPEEHWRIHGGLHYLHAREFNSASGAYDLEMASKVPLSASLAVVYRTQFFDTALFARFYDAHGKVEEAAPLDLSWAWRYAEDAQFKLGVSNLLDEEYFLVAGYPMPGRTLLLEWRVAF